MLSNEFRSLKLEHVALPSTTVAYMAGFFDAEGTVGISDCKGMHYVIFAHVTQKTTSVLYLFKHYFGGMVKESQYYTSYWRLGGYKARMFLELIEPYLIVKKEQVQLAISFHNHQWAQKNPNQFKPMSKGELEFRRTQKLLITKMKIDVTNQVQPLLMPIHNHQDVLAYLAGFFDGEGYIGIRTEKVKGHKSKYQYRLACSANQCCRIPLDLLCSNFGGSIRWFARDKKRKDGIRSHLYVWTVNTRQAKIFLESIIPFLVIKKEEARIGIEFQNGIKNNSGGMYGVLTDEQIAIRNAQVLLLRNLKKIRNIIVIQ